MTLEERIRWVLARRGFTQRDWGAKAELAESYIGRLLNRLKDDPGATMEAPASAALAKAAGVSSHWLSTGEGEPEGPEPAPAVMRPVYRNLENWKQAVAEALRSAPWYRQWPMLVEAAGETSALFLTGPATPELVLKTLDLLWETADPDKLEEAETKRVEGEIDASEARYAHAMLLQKQMRDRGEHPPPIKVLMAQMEKVEKRAAKRKPPHANDPKDPAKKRTAKKAGDKSS